VNLAQKCFPFLCLYHQSPCALLLTSGICDRDVIVVGLCILPRIYIFLELETTSDEFYQISSYINCRDFAVIFAIIYKSVRCFFTIFCRDFLPSLNTLVQPASKWMHWASLQRHSDRFRAATSTSCQHGDSDR